jgi:hypothetical protein
LTKLIDTIDKFTCYLNQKASRNDLEQHMVYYGKNIALNTQDLYLTDLAKDSSGPDLRAAVERFLDALNIPQDRRNTYFSKNISLHDLLIELKKDNRYQPSELEIDLFLGLVEQNDGFLNYRNPIGLANLIVVGLLFVVSLIIPFTVPATVPLIKFFLNPATGMPFMGLSYSITVFFNDLYQTYLTGKKTLYEKSVHLAFLFSNASFKFTAYSLWILASSTMPPLVGSLFVIGPIIYFSKEVYYAYRIHKEYQLQRQAEDANPGTTDLKRSMRLEHCYQRHQNAAMVNLAVAFITIGLMGVWCFFPGGIVMVGGIIASLIVILTVRWVLEKWNDKRMQNKLDHALQELSQESDLNNCSSAQLALVSEKSKSLDTKSNDFPLDYTSTQSRSSTASPSKSHRFFQTQEDNSSTGSTEPSLQSTEFSSV